MTGTAGSGRPAPKRVRHFLVEEALHERVRSRAEREGGGLSGVVNSVLRDYAEGDGGGEAAPPIPAPVAGALRSVALSGDSVTLSGYLAALADAGWPMAALAAALPERHVPARRSPVKGPDGEKAVLGPRDSSPTRQAVQLRVKQAREKGIGVPAGLPVPQSPAKPARADKGGPKKSCMVRVSDGVYDRARARAEREGVPMTAVLARELEKYAAGGRAGVGGRP